MPEDTNEECGIAAVYIKGNGDSNNRCLFYLYRLLLNMQNRGQVSAGISTYNHERNLILRTYKDVGSVNEVFRTSSMLKSIELFKKFSGNKGIGHVRYSTAGKDDKSYAQPFERKHGRLWKWFTFAFNGNLANYPELKEELIKKRDYHITFDTDTEIIMHYLSTELLGNECPDMVGVFSRLSKRFDGSYNIAFMNGYGDMVISRDPLGIRPLCYAEKDGVFLAASESSALSNCGFTEFKTLEPGHLILIKDDKISVHQYAKSKRKAYCMFEYVYFSNVASVINDKSVYISRVNLGKELAKIETEKINNTDYIVVPVPDTAKAAADAYAFELGLPSMEGLIRNRYVGRTFIETSGREDKVQNKYTVLKEIVEGKKIILVDDSIVRGTTTKQIVKFLKTKGGAKEVHLRITCPPITGPCYYGIDMSTVTELLVPKYIKEIKADGKILPKEILDKIAQDLGADSLVYLPIDGLSKAIGIPKNDLCLACLNGDYPTECGKQFYAESLDKFNKGVKENSRAYQC